MNRRIKKNRNQKNFFIPQEIFSKKYTKKKRKKYEWFSLFKRLKRGFHILYIIIPILGVSFYTLYFSGFFSIQEIVISSPDNRININRAYESINYLRRKNIFLIKEEEIKRNIFNAIASAESISITKIIPQSLNINIVPYKVLFTSYGHLILSNGSLLKSDEKYEETSTLVLSQSNEDIEILNIKSLYAIKSIIEKVHTIFPEFNLYKSYFAITENELILRNKLGNLFIFDLSKNIEEQIEKLSLFHSNNLNIHKTPFIYVDIRVPQKVYLCALENERICKKNIEYIYGNNTFFTEIPEDASQSQP